MAFHLTLAQGMFHSVSLYNQDAPAVAAIVAPLLRGETIEVREHRWVPRETKVTVMEGPALAVGQFTMGFSWRNATRKSTDVTPLWMDPERSPALSGLAPGPPAPRASAGAPAPIAPASSSAVPSPLPAGPASGAATVAPAPDPRRIAVLGGLDAQPAEALVQWLAGHELTVLDRLAIAEATGAFAPGPVELVEHALALAAVVVIVLGSPTTPSPGLLVEAGAALALGPARTVVVASGALAADPELVALRPARLEASAAALGELARRLRLAGAAFPAASGPLEPGPLADL